MKKKNFVLIFVFLIAVSGAVLAFKVTKFYPPNVYIRNSDGTYTLISCSTIGVTRCTPQSVPCPSNYYTYSPTAGYALLVCGTPLYRPEQR